MGGFLLYDERPLPKQDEFVQGYTQSLLRKCVDTPIPYWPYLVNRACQRLLDAGHNEAAVRRIYRRVVRELRLEPDVPATGGSGTSRSDTTGATQKADHPRASKNALILVDLQNDFLPGGALAVPEGDAVLPVANRLQAEFPLVIATQDWHPPGHVSFAASHPGRSVGDDIEIDGRKQKLWPVHCLQSSRGAELADSLEKGRIARVIHKGTDEGFDSYSGFFDDGGCSTGLEEFLRENGVTTVYVMGLATEYCLRATAFDALRSGFDVVLVADGCRGVDPLAARCAIEEMALAGVKIAESTTLLGR